MAKGTEITRVAYQGSIFTIEFYVKQSGEALAEHWLEAQSEAMQVKFASSWTISSKCTG